MNFRLPTGQALVAVSTYCGNMRPEETLISFNMQPVCSRNRPSAMIIGLCSKELL
jgi:hypothetical protein